MSRLSRRRFMYGVASVAGAAFAGPHILRAAEPNKEKLRIAFVATGGRAGGHIGLARKETCPCYCDVDPGRWAAAKGKDGKKKGEGIADIAPNAKAYTDYRKMFDAHMKEIDAVVVATPDHNHACASAIALREGKACYTEKPLTWSVAEARTLAELAAAKKVATQMGNQGHSNEGNRRIVEAVRAGLIGDILEVHCWTNRPIWAQGIQQRPPSEPVPAGLDWDSWLGPAPFREYHKGLHSFAWRGWFDFGCGAVGDMGCHTWDNVFWAMQPDYPTTVELIKIVNRSKETYPSKSMTKWTYPAKGNRPGFVAFWYEGGLKPQAPEEFLTDPVRQNKGKAPTLPASGNLYIGTKGKFLVEGDYGDSGPRLLPEARMKETRFPEKSIPKSIGHHEEWIQAAKGNKPWNFPGSNFAEYAGPLTENMLLAALAIRMGEEGFKIECDPVKRIIKTKEVLQWACREYRQGWPAVVPQSPIS